MDFEEGIKLLEKQPGGCCQRGGISERREPPIRQLERCGLLASDCLLMGSRELRPGA